MATVPREWVDGFVESLTTVSEHVKAHLRASLAGVEWDRPVAEVREELVLIFRLECAQGAGMASALAAEFYDGIRERMVGSGIGAVASDRYADPVALEGAVRALVEPIAKAAPEGMPEAVERVTGGLVERLGYEVKRAAGETLYDNARLDPRKPRFARVPRGSRSYPNGCPFCQMLASRGFAYVSEASAGALDPHHYHDDCRCAIVPSWDRSPEVEGYDPKAYDEGYREWSEADHSEHETNRYVANMVTRGNVSPEMETTADAPAGFWGAVNLAYKARFEGKRVAYMAYGDYLYTYRILGYGEYRIVGRQRIL